MFLGNTDDWAHGIRQKKQTPHNTYAERFILLFSCSQSYRSANDLSRPCPFQKPGNGGKGRSGGNNVIYQHDRFAVKLSISLYAKSSPCIFNPSARIKPLLTSAKSISPNKIAELRTKDLRTAQRKYFCLIKSLFIKVRKASRSVSKHDSARFYTVLLKIFA